jgi:hypothetical protein
MAPTKVKADEADEREADTGRNEDVELEQYEPPSTDGAVYEGSQVSEGRDRPWLS